MLKEEWMRGVWWGACSIVGKILADTAWPPSPSKHAAPGGVNAFGNVFVNVGGFYLAIAWRRILWLGFGLLRPSLFVVFRHNTHDVI